MYKYPAFNTLVLQFSLLTGLPAVIYISSVHLTLVWVLSPCALYVSIALTSSSYGPCHPSHCGYPLCHWGHKVITACAGDLIHPCPRSAMYPIVYGWSIPKELLLAVSHPLPLSPSLSLCNRVRTAGDVLGGQRRGTLSTECWQYSPSVEVNCCWGMESPHHGSVKSSFWMLEAFPFQGFMQT